MGEVSLNKILLDMAEKWPQREAVCDDKQSYSYQAIESDASIVAGFLVAHGVGSHSRVLLCFDNDYASIVIYWAVLKTSAAIVLVNPSYDKATLKKIAEEICPAVIFVKGGKDFTDDSYMARPSVSGNYYCVINFLQRSYYTWADILSSEPYFDLMPTNQNRLAMIIYTSGSSGIPKGVMLTHRNIGSALKSINLYLNYQISDTVFCCLPLSFDYGLYQMLLTFSCGGRLVLGGSLSLPHHWAHSLLKHEVTVFPMVPKMVSLLREANLSLVFPKVRLLSFTGSKLREPHVDMLNHFFPRAKIYAMYGLTECKRCSYIPPERIKEKIHSVGRVIPGTHAWIEDELGNLMPTGEAGELVIQSERTMMAYWNNPTLTRLRLRRSRHMNTLCLYTGDYCSLDDEGYIYYLGRVEDVIIHNGRKLSLISLENSLFDGALEEQSFLASIDDGNWRINCFIVLNDLSHTQQVNKKARRLFSRHGLNYRLYVLPTLPRTLNGKVDKERLKSSAHSMAILSQSKESLPCCL